MIIMMIILILIIIDLRQRVLPSCVQTRTTPAFITDACAKIGRYVAR